jgi:hypothetical protein
MIFEHKTYIECSKIIKNERKYRKYLVNIDDIINS